MNYKQANIKDIDIYLESTNKIIFDMQKQVNFYTVIQLFNKLKEFCEICKSNGYKSNIEISSKDSTFDLGFWLNFDNSFVDMQDTLESEGISTSESMKKIENYLNLPFTMTKDMTLGDFVQNCTSEDYQKKFLAYKLDEVLNQKNKSAKLKI